MNNLSEMKARQSTKIRQLAKAANIDSLEEFASALNIPRSTAWPIRTGQHKASGLTASIVERMLAAPHRLLVQHCLNTWRKRQVDCTAAPDGNDETSAAK
jgi:hypothetical protein